MIDGSYRMSGATSAHDFVWDGMFGVTACGIRSVADYTVTRATSCDPKCKRCVRARKTNDVTPALRACVVSDSHGSAAGVDAPAALTGSGNATLRAAHFNGGAA
jgi:hypothetical protein